jgi:hypothetical protein
MELYRRSSGVVPLRDSGWSTQVCQRTSVAFGVGWVSQGEALGSLHHHPSVGPSRSTRQGEGGNDNKKRQVDY